jgi:hypothetical protein
MATFLRYVVLGNALLLALPPGWCCVSPAQTVDSKAKTPPPRNCCHCSEANESQQTSLPAKPTVPSVPCCKAGSFTVAASPEKTVKMPVADTVAFSLRLIEVADVHPVTICGLPISSPPLHLLNCLWLC